MATRTIFKKATDGKITTESYAKRHPSTTYKQTVKVPAKKGK